MNELPAETLEEFGHSPIFQPFTILVKLLHYCFELVQLALQAVYLRRQRNERLLLLSQRLHEYREA